MRKFINAIDVKPGDQIMFAGPKAVVAIESRPRVREVHLQLEGYRSTIIKGWYDKVVLITE